MVHLDLSASLFVNHLIASRAAPGCRAALYNTRFTLRRRDGTSERRVLPGVPELAEALDRDFGIAPLPSAALETIAAKAQANSAQPGPCDTGFSSPGSSG